MPQGYTPDGWKQRIVNSVGESLSVTCKFCWLHSAGVPGVLDQRLTNSHLVSHTSIERSLLTLAIVCRVRMADRVVVRGGVAGVLHTGPGGLALGLHVPAHRRLPGLRHHPPQPLQVRLPSSCTIDAPRAQSSTQQ